MAAVLIRVPPTFNTDRHFPTLRLRPWAHGGQGRAAEKGGLAYGRFAALERRRPWLVMVGRSFAFARWLLLGRESQQRGAMAMAGRHPPRRATPSFFLPHLLRRPPPFRGSRGRDQSPDSNRCSRRSTDSLDCSSWLPFLCNQNRIWIAKSVPCCSSFLARLFLPQMSSLSHSSSAPPYKFPAAIIRSPPPFISD